MLTKEQILEAQDITKELVNIPEWGGDIYVCTMTGEERDSFEVSIMDKKSNKVNFANIRAKLCAKTIRDEEGNLMFTDKDVEKLGKKSALALDRVYEVAQRLNGIGKKEIDELTKNSESEG